MAYTCLYINSVIKYNFNICLERKDSTGKVTRAHKSPYAAQKERVRKCNRMKKSLHQALTGILHMPRGVKGDTVIIPTGNKESEKWEDFDSREEITCLPKCLY